MTLAEKIANLDTEAPAISSLGLNSYNWWSEATHGLSHVNDSGKTPASTNFAFPITTAASFNRTLWRATGAAISRTLLGFESWLLDTQLLNATAAVPIFVQQARRGPS
eukprot:4181003-Prymnesium_polylepis.1